jgi:acetyl esterase/lipase
MGRMNLLRILQRILVLCGIMLALQGYGQRMERVVLSKSDTFDLYANIDQDSTTLFYEKLIPKGKPQGALVIMPGAGETIDAVKKQINLHQLAVEKRLLVIFPSINWGTNKHIPEHQMLDQVFRQVVERDGVPKDKFVLGGFSGGGMLALTYTEKANRNRDSTFILPKAVFGVDPPLDYAHLWKVCEKDVQRNLSPAAVAEGKWVMGMYTEEFGGPPEQFRENYVRYSIFSYSEPDGGNARYLRNTPILLYTEPDVLWQMQNRQRDYYDMNCVDIAAMINLLQAQGNKAAKLVVT